jgi:hypothetical protein
MVSVPQEFAVAAKPARNAGILRQKRPASRAGRLAGERTAMNGARKAKSSTNATLDRAG